MGLNEDLGDRENVGNASLAAERYSQTSKNWDDVKSFLAYCVEHPEERFWQALRNWSG